MAKKKRRLVEEPQEEYEFTPTEFNEREFILKDIYMTKVFMVIAVLAIIVGIVGAVICNHTGWWWLATIISFVVCALLTKILGALKFRVDMLEMNVRNTLPEILSFCSTRISTASVPALSLSRIRSNRKQ